MSSNYFSRIGASFWQGVQRSVFVKGSAIQDPVEALIGQGKLLLGYSRSFHSVSGTFTDLHVFLRPGTVAAAQANLHIVNRRKKISVVGAFSRAISTPSVSGPSFQVCGYHIDHLLSDTSRATFHINSQKALMAVCGSRTALADCSISNLTSRPVQPGVAACRSYSSYSRISFQNCLKASMSLKNKEQPNKFFLYGYFIYNVAKRKGNSMPFPGFGFEGFHTSSPACSSTGTASDVSFDNSMQGELHSSSADSSDLKIPTDRTLKLNSASCYLPHPDKEETGGEDAHFICSDEQAIGVADGVGGWADLGVDSGQYARELMSNSVNAIQEEPRGSIDPARVLEKAHTSTKAKGSSTACIIVQMCLLLAVCFWLIYQVKHSHDKKKEFDETDSKTSLSRESSNDILRLGRKDIRPRVEETVIKNGKHDEAATEQESTEEEDVEDEQEIKKAEEKEDDGAGGGDDEINEDENEKSDAEVDREEEFIDEEKEGDKDSEDSTEEKDSEENNDEREKGGSLEDSDHDGDEHGTHEAREENYKADDASSAVAHDNQTVDPESENASLEDKKEQHITNNLEQENKDNNSEEGDKRTELEVDMAKSEKQTNITTNGAEESLKEKSDNGSPSNATLTEGFNDHMEKRNSSSEMKTESLDLSTQNGTENKLELNPGQNRTVGSTTSRDKNNSTLDVNDSHVDSNSTIVKVKESESSSGVFSDSSNNSESSLDAGNNTESLMEKNDATEVEKSDNNGGTDEFSDKTSQEVQHDPIDLSDSSNSLDEKDVRTDLETLPEIQTAGTSIEDAAAE